MKIYTKVVIDIESGKVLETESFDYEGEVALCCGGGDAPSPTRAERRLQRGQRDILEQQREDTALMRPFVLEGMGLIEGADGELRYMTEEERLAGMSTTERSQYDITQLAQERQMKAYAGELPISPALEKSLEDQYAKLTESLSRRLGPGWMETTAGQQAMSRFTQTAELVREEARRGEITGGGANTLQSFGFMEGLSGAKTGAAFNYPGRTTGLMSGYSSILDRMSRERMARYQAGMSQRAGFMGGMGSLIGSGVQAYGTYAGLQALAPAAATVAPVAVASSREFKENIETIKLPLEKLEQIRGVHFDWKNGHIPDVGVIAEEIEPVIPEAVIDLEAGKHVFYHKIIPLLIESVKAQQEQINLLKGELYARQS